nr:hypothetical protein [Mycoplasmopsis bovis]
MNNYSEVAIELQSKLEEAINNIFEITNNEISINVEDVNILQRDNNSINSSTAIGYILEEYLIKIINISYLNFELILNKIAITYLFINKAKSTTS